MANLEYWVNLRALLILALIMAGPIFLQPDGWQNIGFFAACMIVLEMIPIPGWNRSLRKRNHAKLKDHSATHVSVPILLVIITAFLLLFMNIPFVNDQTVWIEIAMLALAFHMASIAMDQYLATFKSLPRLPSEAVGLVDQISRFEKAMRRTDGLSNISIAQIGQLHSMLCEGPESGGIRTQQVSLRWNAFTGPPAEFQPPDARVVRKHLRDLIERHSNTPATLAASSGF